jgi:hypothetical protein
MTTRPTAKSVFSLFKRLSRNNQAEFIRLARADGENPIAWLVFDNAVTRLDEMIADGERMKAASELHRIKRKPNVLLEIKVVRLHEQERMSFGQIGKQLTPSKTYDAVRKIYARGKKRRAAGS